MVNFLKQLLDCIYKRKCYLCGKSHENVKICSKCFKELRKTEFNHSYDIDIQDSVHYYHAGYYAKNMQKLIRGIKYHQQREIAEYLAQFTYDYWKKFKISEAKFIIVPVPLYKKREKKRKYNHMTLIAEEFARLTDCEVNTCLIQRIKDTKPQYGLTSPERAENLKDAFIVDKTLYNGENILLFDDILTTGATMREMIKALNAANIQNITVLTVSATVSHK